MEDNIKYNLQAPRILVLKRVAENEDGVFGVLIDNFTIPFALTIERNWQNNKKNISCIPAGMYNCSKINSPKFGWTYQIMDVPSRTNILFHTANTEDDLKGCIGIGERFEYLKNKVAIWNSRDGFNEFKNRLKDNDIFTLIIRDFTK